MKNQSKSFLQGIFVGSLITLTGLFVYLNFPFNINVSGKQEISFERAIELIKNKDTKEITVRQNSLELISKSDEKSAAKIDASDAARNEILATAKEAGTTVKLEPASSGWGWLVRINFIPFIILFGLTVALAVIYNNHLKRKVEK